MCVKDCPIKNPRQIVETISGLLFHAKFKSILKICYELKDKIVIFFGSIDMLNAIQWKPLNVITDNVIIRLI